MAATKGLVFATLLLATLLSCSSADLVTWEKCKSTDVLSSQALKARTIRPFKWDSKATSLYLAHCNIPHLEYAFNGLPKLEEISLGHNNLQFVNPDVFKTVSSLTELDLAFNRLSTVPVFGQYSLFANMTKLSLSSNRISLLLNLKTFTSMQQLQKLYLNDNQLRHIHSEVFKPLVNLRVLDLGFNKLSYIPSGLLNIRSLKTIHLNDNLIQYVSPTAFGNQVRHLVLSANRLSYLPKDFVLKLNHGMNLKNIVLASNPWKCACLKEVLLEVKALGVCDEYYEYAFNGQKPKCIAHEKTECERPSEEDELLSVSLAEDYMTRTKPYPYCSVFN